MKIDLQHPVTLQYKQCKVGFSWTTFFFGCFTALFRGDWKWALIMLVAGFFSMGISSFVFSFIYNKVYINDLLNAGYIAMDEHSESTLRVKGFVA